MKGFPTVLQFMLFAMLMSVPAMASRPTAGFFLPDSVQEMTLRYRMVKDLVVLPVMINDSVKVNLILDTGCRNLILFGKRFRKLFRKDSSRPVQFSGLGDGRPLVGALSLGNKVSINHVLGEQIPVVVVPENNIFGHLYSVDGVIGYDIFVKFEIELNAAARTITFRPASISSPPPDYTTVPLEIIDSRPIMKSEVHLAKGDARLMELMIDTGSSLGLLLKTTNIAEFTRQPEKVLGIGLNGPLSGYKIVTEKLTIRDLEMRRVRTGIVLSNWHNNASIGMEILKEYVVILNYCKAYASFRRHEV